MPSLPAEPAPPDAGSPAQRRPCASTPTTTGSTLSAYGRRVEVRSHPRHITVIGLNTGISASSRVTERSPTRADRAR